MLQSDIDTLDVKAITEHGGSVIAVDLQGRVTLIGGTPLFTKQTLNMEEWTSFLTSCSSPEGSYNYTVAYEETKDFWLVVGFPSSIRINISVAANTRSTTFGKSVLFCSLLLLMLFLLLFISSLIYARLSAKTFITPLRQLCSIVKRMTCGNYHE